MKVIAKVDDYGQFLVQIHRNELNKLCAAEADKLKVGDVLNVDEGLRELNAIRYDKTSVGRASKMLREAADRLDRVGEIKLLERPQRKKGA